MSSVLNFSLVLILLTTLTASNFKPASCANILVYGILSSYSQRISMWSMVEELAEKGHNVTYMSPFESKNPHPKVHDYAPKKWKEHLGESWEEHSSFYEKRKNKLVIRGWFSLLETGVAACDILYSDKEFVNWANSSRFDLVIVDSLMNECAYGLAHISNAKIIRYCTLTAMAWEREVFGLPDESSSISDAMFNFPPGDQMSFFQRFVNAMSPLVWRALREYWFLPKLEETTKKGLGLKDIPNFIEIERKTSLVLLTTHYSMDYPRSLTPNAVAVGGVTVSKEQKALPKNLENFINQGKHGFIYISFGTVAEFVNFDESVREGFIRAISNFPDIQFIWKSAFEIKETLPKNVLVTKWAPQQSLLAHPKIKAFISHCGMGSTVETVHFGVPVIALPILAEQDMNAHGLTSRGAGILLEVTTLTQAELENAISEILNNPTYTLRMKRLSEVFKDRPTNATQNAVWWIEYILRHDDSNEFLHPPSMQQSWWVRRQLDVWLVAFLLVLAFINITLYAVYRYITMIACWIRGPRKEKIN